MNFVRFHKISSSVWEPNARQHISLANVPYKIIISYAMLVLPLIQFARVNLADNPKLGSAPRIGKLDGGVNRQDQNELPKPDLRFK